MLDEWVIADKHLITGEELLEMGDILVKVTQLFEE